MTTTTVAKKDIQKLQRAIVDGLEDVKAQDIQVFDTEHLSALFERVIIASGTSNRQTKALAGSVRDAVRDAGFPKPRVEGETNGEWIIVDCGQAVVHIMQPSFRQYYNLEELWGEKPVRLKFGSAKPAMAEAAAPEKAVKDNVKPEGNLKRANAAKKGVAEAFPSKAQVKKTMAAKSAAAKAPAKRAAAKRSPAQSATAVEQRPAKKVPVKSALTKVTVNAPAKSAAKKAPAKTAAKAVAKKAPVRKPPARKA
ncbi:MAG: ribosome silencing factor [Rhodoferax sp.]|uniref:ribosome silencing factor n=1 Tax=Rhodoferax sp. TaxID=50421 RepID=UPI002728AA13|nr:ribosome silencing factor [Rhodoferax sp.]MDO8450049.1 ribosome silencing factor [Rhodoferax sp.]